MNFLYILAGIVIVRTLWFAILLQKNGLVISSTRFGFQPVNVGNPETEEKVDEISRELELRLLGKVELPEKIRENFGIFMLTDSESEIAVFLTLPIKAQSEHRIECYSFFDPMGKLYSAIGNPSSLARNPTQIYSFFDTTISNKELIKHHKKSVTDAKNERRYFRPVERSTVLEFLYLEDQNQVDFQIRKGYAKRLSNDTWKFTLKANLLTSIKFSIPLFARTILSKMHRKVFS